MGSLHSTKYFVILVVTVAVVLTINIVVAAVETVVAINTVLCIVRCLLSCTLHYRLPQCRQPSIVEIQILRVGQFMILCVPGELTTMAGRRLREAMQAQVGGLNLQHSSDSARSQGLESLSH